MREKSLLSDQVYENIKNGIISLKYPPYSAIKEREISENLGVSRTPVREAIQRLTQEAWLVPGEGKRMQVRPITSKDVHEIIQIRNLVEYSALDELFARGEPRVIAGQLDFILNEMKAAQEEYSLVTLDLKFHNLLVESMNNGRLLRFWCAVQDEVKRMGLLRLRGNDRWQEVINEHERVVEMLWNKDPVRTKLALREHLEHSYANLTNDIE